MQIILAFLACVLIWGSTWYAIELQLGVVPKEWSVVYRFVIASGVLFLVCFFRKEKLKVAARDHIWVAGTGLFLFSGTYILTYTGAEFLTSGLVAISFSLLSFLNIVNGRLFLGNRIQGSSLLAALIGVAGLIFVFKPEIEAFSLTDTSLQGLIYCLLATVVCSLGNTLAGAPKSQSIPLFTFNAYALGYGALFNTLYALSTGSTPALDMQFSYVGSLIYLSIVGTVIAFSIYLWLIDQIGIGRAAYMSVMTPVVALSISTFMEGFIWTSEAIAGVSFVVFGNLLMLKLKNRPKTSKPVKETN